MEASDANFMGDLPARVEASVRNRHVGQTGMIVVMNEAGEMVSAHGDVSGEAVDQLAASAANAGAGKMFTRNSTARTASRSTKRQGGTA